MTIQIEEGKFYKRADGSVHGPARERGGDMNQPYPWQVGFGSYTNDGSYYIDQTGSVFDLVAEASAPFSDQHAAEIVEGKPDVEDDGFITRDTPEWAATVEQEAAADLVDTFHDLDETPRLNPNDMADAMGLAWAGGFVAVDLAEEPDIKTIIADEAKRIVSGARRSAYGKPEANFERIARFWQAYFENTDRADVKITAADVSPLMRLMKEARLAESPNHYDSFVDLIGYSLTGAEVNGVKKPVA